MTAVDEAALAADPTDPSEIPAADPPVAEGEKPARKTKSGADRRPRGWLESDVKKITDEFITGKITLEADQRLTPHRIAILIKEMDSLEEAPSTGAVAAVFKRWEEINFVQMYGLPYSFKDYTDAGRTEGLTALKEKRSAARKEERKALKAAAKAAAADATTASGPTA